MLFLVSELPDKSLQPPHLFFQNNKQNERKTEITILYASLRKSKELKELKGVKGVKESKGVKELKELKGVKGVKEWFFRAAGFLPLMKSIVAKQRVMMAEACARTCSLAQSHDSSTKAQRAETSTEGF